MRLVIDRRARRLLRRLPRYNWYSLAELALLSLLAIQCARLLLTIVTPLGPVGDWRPDTGPALAVSPTILGTFDPFFRLAGNGGPVVVTGLDLKLYGIRSDQASGRGSAILALPDGTQSSYSVGEEIMPGVRLKSVAFDHVVILRGAAEEQLYLDQSQPVPVVSPAPAAAALPPPNLAFAASSANTAAVPAAALLADAQLSPRIADGGVNGFTITQRGSGEALRAAGFQPGDVIVSVNGAPITGAGDAERVQAQLTRSGEAAVTVERGGQRVPLRVKVDQ